MPNYGFSVSVKDLASIKMKEIEEAMAKMGVKAKFETHEVAKDFEFMGERMAETFKNLKSLLLTGLGITALFEGWEFIENSKEAFERLEKQVARLDTVLKSTNFKAGFSSEDIQNQAKEVSKGIVNSRQEILQAQGTLLSFTNVRGDIFKKALGSVADYATFFGTDLASGARILGRALQDPLQGMNQLRRAGIVLTAQQKEQIKNYEQQGHLVKAQSVLLEELNKKFGGQAQAYAFTDAGKIQVARKQWEELEFKLGEIISRVEVSLIPAFTKIVNVIKGAFNSSAIQFFIEHIKDLVSLALKLLPIWAAYKALMIANAAITSVFAVENGVLTVSMGGLTFTTGGATTAFEGFGAAINAIAFGGLLLGIGLVIEKLTSMNSELSEAIDKKYRLDASNETYKSAKEQYQSIKERMAIFKELDPNEKSQLKSDVRKYIDEFQPQTKILAHRGGALMKDAAQPYGKDTGIKAFLGSNLLKSMTDSTYRTGLETNKKLDEQLKNFQELNKNLSGAKDAWKVLAGNKIKSVGYSSPGSGVKQDAINTSNLSGASGGLGQARIIHVDFHGPFQQNIGVKESKAEAEKAIEKLTEMISGFSQSVNSQ